MNKIVFYHQQSCGPCKMVESLLKKKHIEYESCEDLDIMSSKGITQTPVLEIDGEFIKGKDLFTWINKQ